MHGAWSRVRQALDEVQSLIYRLCYCELLAIVHPPLDDGGVEEPINAYQVATVA